MLCGEAVTEHFFSTLHAFEDWSEARFILTFTVVDFHSETSHYYIISCILDVMLM